MASRITILIQARMSSTRLPGKVLLPLADKPVLGHIVDRCKHVPQAHVVVATSTDKTDDAIERYCQEMGTFCVRGDLSDVLSRYRLAANHYPAPILVRITADCPLIDPTIIEMVIHELPGYDYASNVLSRIIPHGLDVEAFTEGALKKADENAHTERLREHVTLIMRENPSKLFTIHNVVMPQSYAHPELRLTLDTVDDYELMKIIFNQWYHPGKLIDTPQVIRWLTANPEISSINTHVQQKKP
ncbi:MAG: cytidylyltransferase domain-containing protein [Patescibacteria group bacterium]